jgi:hypothetical protein
MLAMSRANDGIDKCAMKNNRRELFRWQKKIKVTISRFPHGYAN